MRTFLIASFLVNDPFTLSDCMLPVFFVSIFTGRIYLNYTLKDSLKRYGSFSVVSLSVVSLLSDSTKRCKTHLIK